MKQPVIYKIINLVNDKFYVGSTTDTRERFRCHRNRLRKNKHHSKHLQAAWNKYGEEKFIFKVVEIVSHADELKAAEDKWLQAHVGQEYCYNKSYYSDSPMRGITKEEHPSYGRKHTEESKELMRQFRLTQPDPRLGKTHTEETKELIRQKKLANPTRAWLGKTRDAETRRKIGDTQRGKPKGPRTYTDEGLTKARENMKRNAKEQKPADFNAVLNKFPEEIQAKYDFTNAVYTGALNRITGCKCAQHGEFSQYAAQFRKGRGCPSCGNEQRAISKSIQMKQEWANKKAAAS